MNYRASPRFWSCYYRLPEDIRRMVGGTLGIGSIARRTRAKERAYYPLRGKRR